MGTLLTQSGFDRLKSALADAFPSVKSSHRTEAAARGFGFGSNAALRTALAAAPARVRFNLNPFTSYLGDRRFTVEPRKVVEAIQVSGIFEPSATVPHLAFGVNEDATFSAFVFARPGFSVNVRAQIDLGMKPSFAPGSAENVAAALSILWEGLDTASFADVAPTRDHVAQQFFGSEWLVVDLPDGNVAGLHYLGMGYWVYDAGPVCDPAPFAKWPSVGPLGTGTTFPPSYRPSRPLPPSGKGLDDVSDVETKEASPGLIWRHPSRYPKHEGDKGQVFGGTCNRTACDATGATWFNRSTFGYYCRPCGAAINWQPLAPKVCVPVDGQLDEAQILAHDADMMRELSARRA